MNNGCDWKEAEGNKGGPLGLFQKKHFYNNFPPHSFYYWADVAGMKYTFGLFR